MSEIAIFAPITPQGVLPAAAELVTAAKAVQSVSGESILVIAAEDRVLTYRDSLMWQGVDEVLLLHTAGIGSVQTDTLSRVLADELSARDISVLLAPADHATRAMLARTAVYLNTGMTAACKELQAKQVDGQTVVHQIKTSFGNQAMVICDITSKPNIITLLPGNYDPASLGGSPNVRVREFDGLVSGIKVLGAEQQSTVNSLTDADYVVCVGKGSMEGDNFELAKQYASKENAAFAGSRPMADQGWIPFESQIGESGTVICPKACLILGVSGAIQFTEGIKGNPVKIAVNTDPQAGITHFADYVAVADMQDILKALLDDDNSDI